MPKSKQPPDMAALGSMGGKARVRNMTAEQLSDWARAANESRWRDMPRCYCGATNWARGVRRNFDCCRRAGYLPYGRQPKGGTK